MLGHGFSQFNAKMIKVVDISSGNTELEPYKLKSALIH